MKKITLTILGAAALAVSATGMAASHNLNSSSAVNLGPAKRAGFYANGGIGYGSIRSTDAGSIDKSGFAWNLAAGYQFNPYIAVEAGYIGLPSIKLGTDPTTGDNVKLNSGIFDLLGKVMYPVADNFDVFAKAGAGLTRSSISDGTSSIVDDSNYFVPIIGGGADYYVTNNLAVTAQVLYNFKNSNNFPSAVNGLVGLSYKI